MLPNPALPSTAQITQGFVNLPTADGSSPSDALLLYDKVGRLLDNAIRMT